MPADVNRLSDAPFMSYLSWRLLFVGAQARSVCLKAVCLTISSDLSWITVEPRRPMAQTTSFFRFNGRTQFEHYIRQRRSDKTVRPFPISLAIHLDSCAMDMAAELWQWHSIDSLQLSEPWE